MTLEFGYFQYELEDFLIRALPSIISSLSIFMFYLFIFLSHRGRKEELLKPMFLKYFAIIGMISAFIPLFEPGYFYVNLTENERSMIIAFLIFQGLINSVPLFLASVLLLFYGINNRNNFGKYLLVAGILMLIYYGFSIITLDWGIGNIFMYLLNLEPITTTFEKLVIILGAFFGILLISGYCLFIIHGARNSDYKFIYGVLIIFISTSIITPFVHIGVLFF
ncbi:MAG: hypothetical protein ACFFCE_11180 [Promethearchaeota archaeon]